MSTVKTGNKTHDDTVNAAEAVKQSAAVPTAPKATVAAAEVTFYQTAAKSAAANGCGITPYLFALKEHGKGLYD